MLSALVLVLTIPSASFAGSSVVSTNVTLLGDTNGTGCAVWVQPAEPIVFGTASALRRSTARFVSRTLGLRVVNGRDVATDRCMITIGGSSFVAGDIEARSIHLLKLSQSPASTAPVHLVPRVNEMALGELQSILVLSPSHGACAVVDLALDTEGIPTLLSDEPVIGTLTFTLSNAAP